jgi:DNA-binding FrmR family transcriptional regulator
MKKQKTVPKRRLASKKPCHGPSAEHANHTPEVQRLRRLRGQIDGVERMIQDGRYCMDILQQLKAARSAIHALEASILRSHLNACVKQAFAAKNERAVEEKIQEITELFTR